MFVVCVHHFFFCVVCVRWVCEIVWCRRSVSLKMGDDCVCVCVFGGGVSVKIENIEERNFLKREETG